MKRRQIIHAAPIVWTRADPVALRAFDPGTKACTMNCGPSFDDPRSPEERRFLCQDCETVKLPRQQDFDWADRQLPAGITRQDVCIWTQDSDGPWNTSCGVTWESMTGRNDATGECSCQSLPQNLEGPAELCPKPAPGLAIDSRGVLVRQDDKDDMTKEYEIYERWTK